MLKLRKIAVTGGVASGKTTVCQFFRELGAFVVNADEIVHELLDSNTEIRQEVIRIFGPSVVKQGKIHRKALADQVFVNPQQLEKLENVLHPAVSQAIEKLYAEACNSGMHELFVVENPLLFEIRGESFYDCVIAVLADEATARRRFAQTGFEPTDYDLRMRRQFSPHQKAARANYIIHNNGSLQDLKKQVVVLRNCLNQTILKHP